MAFATDSPNQGSPKFLVNATNNSPSSSAYVTMYPIQQKTSDPSPWLLYPASNKTVWVVTIKFGKLLQSQIVNFTMGVATPVATLNNTVPTDIVYDHITNDPTKRVWIVENDSIAYYDRAASGNITVAKTFPEGAPQYMTIDPSDHFWLTLLNTDQVVEYNPSNETTHTYATPTRNAGLQGIAISPVDNSTWFAELYAGKIGHLTCNPSPCTITEYNPPSGVSLRGVIQVAVDRDGMVWFTIHDGNEFGSFNPSTGDWKLFPIGYCSDNYVLGCAAGLPNAISLDPEGQVWFSEHYAGRIARYNPNDGTLTEYMMRTTSPVCSKACTPYAWWMWPGQDNLVWFTAFGLGEIGYVNASLPVPFNVTSQPSIVVRQGGSTKISVSTVYTTGSPPFLNASVTYKDVISNPPMISYSMGPEQVDASNSSASSTLTVFAGWNATTGPRYIAVTAYDENVTVNAFVRVDLVPCTPQLWTCTTSLGLYTTLGFAGGISSVSAMALGMNSYRHRKKNNGALQSVKDGESGVIRVLSR